MEIQLIDQFGSAGMPRSTERKWSRRPTAGLMNSSAGWKVATGLLAPTSRSPTSSSPRFCVISAGPTSHAISVSDIRGRWHKQAWRHTLNLYAKRLGVEIADIQ